MKRPLDVESIDDISRYYQGGWISAEENGINQPYVVVTADKNKVYVRPLMRNGEKFHYADEDTKIPWDEAKEKFSFGTPEVGMVMNYEELRYATRLAERHSSRGLRLGRIRFHSFNTWEIRAKCSGDIRPTSEHRPDMIWNLFNPTYYGIRAAIQRLDSGEVVGAPLTRTWGLYSSPSHTYPLLAYKRWTVGYLPDSWRVILGAQFRDYGPDIRNQLNVEVA